MKIAVMARGTSSHIQEWLALWAADGWDVHLITFDPAPIAGVTVHPLTRPFGLVGAAAYIAAGSQAREILRQVRPSVLVAYYITGYGLLATRARFAPLALFVAGSDVQQTTTSRARRIAVRFILRHAAFVQVPAQHLEKLVRSLGYAGPLMTLPRGIDCTKRPTAGQPDANLIVSSRNLHPVYDVATLIRAFARVLMRAPAARLVVVGDGPLRHSLQELATTLAIQEQVAFVGTLPRERIFELLARSAVYVSTSLADGASVSLFEAMLCGAYPVVSDIPANRSFITDGSNGRLFRPGDDSALADAILRALAAPDRASVLKVNQNLVCARADATVNLQRLGTAIRDIASQARSQGAAT
jgi:L-malate glycosyltransferase